MSRLDPKVAPTLVLPLTSAQEGCKLVLECSWSDSSRVTWHKDGNPLFASKDMAITQTRSRCSLVIHRASVEHSGEYTCQASNLHGKAATKCHVTVVSEGNKSKLASSTAVKLLSIDKKPEVDKKLEIDKNVKLSSIDKKPEVDKKLELDKNVKLSSIDKKPEVDKKLEIDKKVDTEKKVEGHHKPGSNAVQAPAQPSNGAILVDSDLEASRDSLTRISTNGVTPKQGVTPVSLSSKEGVAASFGNLPAGQTKFALPVKSTEEGLFKRTSHIASVKDRRAVFTEGNITSLPSKQASPINTRSAAEKQSSSVSLLSDRISEPSQTKVSLPLKGSEAIFPLEQKAPENAIQQAVQPKHSSPTQLGTLANGRNSTEVKPIPSLNQSQASTVGSSQSRQSTGDGCTASTNQSAADGPRLPPSSNITADTRTAEWKTNRPGGGSVNMKYQPQLLKKGEAPVFGIKLRNHFAQHGEKLVLKCRVDGLPKPEVAWEHNGKALTEGIRHKIFERLGFHHLEILSATGQDSGLYTARASNAAGQADCASQVEIAPSKSQSHTTKMEEITAKPAGAAELGQSTSARTTGINAVATTRVTDVLQSVTTSHAAATVTAAPISTNVFEKAVPNAPHAKKDLVSQKTPITTTLKKSNSNVESSTTRSHFVTKGKDEFLGLSPKKIDNIASLNKQVEQFHVKARDAMAELDLLSPRSTSLKSKFDSNRTAGYAVPSFVKKLNDCEVEEGDDVILECRTSEIQKSCNGASAPQFIKTLEDHEVEEGDSVTINCKSKGGFRSQARPPQFTKKLMDQEVEEGDTVIIQCQGYPAHSTTAPPKFIKSLEDRVVEEGDTVEMQCKTPYIATTTGAPKFTQKLRDLQVDEGDSVTVECRSPAGKSLCQNVAAPVFTTKLQDHQVEEGDSVTLVCKTSNQKVGTATNAPEWTRDLHPQDAYVTNKKQKDLNGTGTAPPRFLKKLENQEVEEGESLMISCAHVSAPKPTTVPVTVPNSLPVSVSEPLEVKATANKLATQSTLPKESPKQDGMTEDVAPVHASNCVSPPSVVKHLRDVTVKVGDKVELTTQTAGSLPMDIVWVHNEDELAPDDPDYIQISEGHTHRLLITAAFPEDSGTYICEAYNDLGDTDTACELFVIAPAGSCDELEDELVIAEVQADRKPRFIQPLPEKLAVTEEGTVKLCCTIANVQPEEVIWMKNQRAARQGLRFKMECDGDLFTYEISNALSTDKGLYEVSATNHAGSVTGSCEISVISAVDEAAVASKQRLPKSVSMTSPKIVSGLQDITVDEQHAIVLQCRVEGTPKPTVQWTLNAKELKMDAGFGRTFDNGVAQLEVKSARLDHQGRYSLTVTNAVGSDVTSCFVTVLKPAVVCSTPPVTPAGPPLISDISATGALISWSRSSSDAGSPAFVYQVEACKASLLKISHDKFWKVLTDQCHSTSYRAAGLTTDIEYVFRVRAINSSGESPAGEWSEPVLLTDSRTTMRESESTYGESESQFSEHSDYQESEYDHDLDEAFLDHDVTIRKDRFEDSYDVMSELGKGKFGSVYLANEKKSHHQWAAKKIKCRPSQKADILNEVEIMNVLRHPKLVRLWEVFDQGKEMVLVQEYVGGGELFERIAGDDFELTENDCIRFVKQICDGIGYMHSKMIIHLDLKPENIMCVSKHSNQVKLIDFGLARKYKPGESMKVMFGTPEFVAPEVINYDEVSPATDMWSVGVITYVLLSGLSPFMGDSDTETLSNVTKVAWDFEDEAFDDISTFAKDFVSNLLVRNKESRLTAAAASNHVWLHDTKTSTRHLSLVKTKDKMKRFVARRKWQKTGKAIMALTRMRTSFLTKQASNAGLCPTEQTSILLGKTTLAPESKRTIEGQSSTEGTVAKDSAFLVDGLTESINHRCTEDRDHIKEYVLGDHMSDARDSGYEDRKSTAELTDIDTKSTSSAEISVADEYELSLPSFLCEMPEHTSVIQGDSCRLDVTVRSTPNTAIHWFKDGLKMIANPRVSFHTERQKHSLLLRDVIITDDAEYECRAVNEHGECSSFGEVLVISHS